MASLLKFPLFLLAAGGLAQAAPADDALAVANLDIAYQAAVLRGDADTMARTFHDDFILVTGRGTRSNARDWLTAAREGHVKYEHQEVIDDSRSVKVDGDTAVVTAKLWIKGTWTPTAPNVIKGESKAGDSFNRVLWYSDTYVRTKAGWKYFFGQASLALPAADTAQAAASQHADVEAVRAMNDNYIRSWRQRDMQWFRDNLADNYVCTAPDGSVLSKQEFINYPDQSAAIADSRVDDLAVKVVGETAIVTGNNIVYWKDGRISATRYTDTYAKVGGKWKAVSAQLTSDKHFVPAARS